MFDFFENEQLATLNKASRSPSAAPDAGVFDNFWSGAGNYAMRSLAEAGRAVSMAGAAIPIAADKLLSSDNLSGKSLSDQYFRVHDEVFNNAVDHWTPRPGEVGAAGQIAGQLAGGVMQAVISPALLVGTSQLSSAEDLVRNGVDATTANTVGAIQGSAMAVGIKLPFLGQSLATRVLSGAGGNLAQGAAASLASSEVLKEKGYDNQAEQFNPWDLRARTLDVMLGAAFGGLAHLEARGVPKLKPTDEAALLVANQARHLEDSTPQGRPATDADATMHVDAMRQAIDQVLRGERVTVDALTKDMQMVPDDVQYQQRAEVMEEAQRLAQQDAPIEMPILSKIAAEPLGEGLGAPADHSPESLKARQFAQEQPELAIPTNNVDTDGARIMLKASDAIALADAEVAHVQANAANLFKTAAHCLLGVL